MVWQSNVLAVVQLAFTVALLPTLLNAKAQVPRSTSSLTAVGLWVIAATYTTLALWSAVAMGTLTAAAWTYIAIWRPVQRSHPPGGCG